MRITMSLLGGRYIGLSTGKLSDHAELPSDILKNASDILVSCFYGVFGFSSSFWDYFAISFGLF